MSNTIVKLSVLDKNHLERPLLSREDTKSNHYSKDRLTVVEKGRPESEARPIFPKSVSREETERLEIEEAIRELSIARERWANATRHLSGMEQSDAAREFVNRCTTYRANFKLAAAELGLGLHLDKSKSKFSKDLKSKLTPAHSSAPTTMQESQSSDSSVSPMPKKKKSKQVAETPEAQPARTNTQAKTTVSSSSTQQAGKTPATRPAKQPLSSKSTPTAPSPATTSKGVSKSTKPPMTVIHEDSESEESDESRAVKFSHNSRSRVLEDAIRISIKTSGVNFHL